MLSSWKFLNFLSSLLYETGLVQHVPVGRKSSSRSLMYTSSIFRGKLLSMTKNYVDKGIFSKLLTTVRPLRTQKYRIYLNIIHFYTRPMYQNTTEVNRIQIQNKILKKVTTPLPPYQYTQPSTCIGPCITTLPMIFHRKSHFTFVFGLFFLRSNDREMCNINGHDLTLTISFLTTCMCKLNKFNLPAMVHLIKNLQN